MNRLSPAAAILMTGAILLAVMVIIQALFFGVWS